MGYFAQGQRYKSRQMQERSAPVPHRPGRVALDSVLALLSESSRAMPIEVRILAPEGRHRIAQANGLGTVRPLIALKGPRCFALPGLISFFALYPGFTPGLYVLPLRGIATRGIQRFRQ